MTANQRAIRESKPMWILTATKAAPLGKKAIQEYLGKWAEQLGVTIRHVAVVEHPDYVFHVAINFFSGGILSGWEIYEFDVRNPNIVHAEWEKNRDWTIQQQARLSPGTRGLPHNADKFMTDTILSLVRRTTGYTGLTYCDLWVHVCEKIETAQGQQGNEGMVAFGPITEPGQIAFDRYLELTRTGDDLRDDAGRSDRAGEPCRTV